MGLIRSFFANPVRRGDIYAGISVGAAVRLCNCAGESMPGKFVEKSEYILVGYLIRRRFDCNYEECVSIWVRWRVLYDATCRL